MPVYVLTDPCTRRNVPVVPIVCWLLVALALGLLGWVYKERYYLRIVPLPLSLAHWLDKDGWLLPASADLQFDVDYAPFNDLASKGGMRQALARLQLLMPPDPPIAARPTFTTAQQWLDYVLHDAQQCTDATLLFQIGADRQGIATREWQLLDAGWSPGQGHSVVEYRHPLTGRWILIDAQNGCSFRDSAGRRLSMVEVLRLHAEKRARDIHFKYNDVAAERGRTGMTERYFLPQRLLDQPLLQLRPPSFIGRATTNAPVIAYAIYTPGSQHDHRVVTTKIGAVAALLSLVVAGLLRRRRAS